MFSINVTFNTISYHWKSFGDRLEVKMPAKSTKKATEKKDGTALQKAEKSDEAGLALQVSTDLSPGTGKVV